MKAKMFVLVAALAIGSGPFAAAASIPAGTAFVVRTMNSLSSRDSPGTRVHTQLANNITVGGKVVLAAGTKVEGTVITSRRMLSHPEKLTVNMASFQVNGRSVPISTTGAQHVSNHLRSGRDISVSNVDYTVASGMLLRFHLARAVNL
jgi:hypothetical protein